MKSNMTYHARYERVNRIDYILDSVGFGDVVVTCKETDKYNRLTTHELTSSGVIVIRSEKRVVVTMYIASVNEAMYVWRRAHGNIKMPNYLYKQVVANKKLAEKQPRS